jgi:hypothetical protein
VNVGAALRLGVLFITLALGVPTWAAELVVFLPGVSSQLEVQRRLETDPACAGLTITVAAKWRIFEEALERHPALVLAPATLASVPGWRPELQAVVAGSERFRYLLVAGDAALTLAQLDHPAVGLVQELPRGDVDGFLTAAFPGLVPGRVRLAAKADDVPNLLGLELARVCVLTPGMLEGARARLAGSLHVIARSGAVWHPMVYSTTTVPGGAGRTLLDLAPATLAALGFDHLVARDPAVPAGWQAPEEGLP